MDAAPKISVLLPCYRQERFVREAVESVLMQDFPDWEMVASDDASPDGTAAILEEYARRDPRIRFCHQKSNLGMVENWNWCLQQGQGEAVKLMGGDDRLLSSDCLSRQWKSLQRPGVALAACARHIMDADSRVVQTLSNLPAGFYSAAKILPRMLVHQDNLVGEPVCCLFRRSDAPRGFNPAYRQNTDIEMWLHLLKKGGLVYDPAPLVGFRIHHQQASTLNWQSGLAQEEHRVLFCKESMGEGVPPGQNFKYSCGLRRS